jgi:hypothetical protein
MGVASLVLLAGAWLAMRRTTRGGTSAARPIVELRVNGRHKAVGNEGAPVRFDVTLAAAPGAGVVVGSRWRPWHRLIYLELENGRALPWPVQQDARPSSLTMSLDSEGGLVVASEILAAVPLDGRRINTVAFESSPGAIGAGTYRVRAVLEAPSWMFWAWHGRVTSAPVVVDIRRGDPALEGERLAATAVYYLRRGRYAEARPLADTLVQRDPRRSGSHALMGRVLEGLGDRQGAIDAYARALQLMPRTYEEPAELIDRMGRLVAGGQRGLSP